MILQRFISEIKLASDALLLSQNGLNSPLSVLGGCMQVRNRYKTPKRRKTHLYEWLVPVKSHPLDEGITQQNKEFIQEVIQGKFPKFGESPLKEQPWERGQWTEGSVRTGVIAKKIGIYPMWTKNGRRLLTTLLQVLDNHTIKYHPPEVYGQSWRGKKFPGFGSLVVGADAGDPQMFTARYCGLFAEAGVMPKRKLTRFIVSPNAAIQPGTPLDVSHFRVGDLVNVYGKTIDHGFQGVVKRWKFKGGPASHGCTKSHRRPGAIGGGSRYGEVWKGKKMPGHMGCERRCVRNLKIWRINTKYNVMWVHGPAIPGANNSYVSITDSVLGTVSWTEQNRGPFPTSYPEDLTEPLPEEMYALDLHIFSDPSIVFKHEAKAAVSKKKKK